MGLQQPSAARQDDALTRSVVIPSALLSVAAQRRGNHDEAVDETHPDALTTSRELRRIPTRASTGRSPTAELGSSPMALDPPIRRVSSRVVYENRWMVVREDQTERLDGATGIYGVVEKEDFALVIPFDGLGFYVVEQYRYPVQGTYVEFPQGSWEDSPGVDAAELARGELAEETGLRAASMRHLGHLFEAYGYSNQGFHVFLATDLRDGDQALSETESDLRVLHLSLDEFGAAIRDGRIKDAPTLAAFALLQLALPDLLQDL
jgi:ADP-ribose pyrophosphatase